MAASSDSTEYESLRAALAAWKSSKDRRELWEEVENLESRLVERLGKTIRVHIPASEPYIALTFAKPGKIGAYVHVGYVDHVIELAGSAVPEASPDCWRTQMSSSWGSKTVLPESSSTAVLCPIDKLEVPKNGSCPKCDWSPSQDA